MQKGKSRYQNDDNDGAMLKEVAHTICVLHTIFRQLAASIMFSSQVQPEKNIAGF